MEVRVGRDGRDWLRREKRQADVGVIAAGILDELDELVALVDADERLTREDLEGLLVNLVCREILVLNHGASIPCLTVFGNLIREIGVSKGLRGAVGASNEPQDASGFAQCAPVWEDT